MPAVPNRTPAGKMQDFPGRKASKNGAVRHFMLIKKTDTPCVPVIFASYAMGRRTVKVLP